MEKVDCHALQGKARNDKKGKFSKTPQDFKTTAKDSKICDEKSGLSSDWQGSYLLGGNDRRQSRRIHDLSRKAESTSKAIGARQ